MQYFVSGTRGLGLDTLKWMASRGAGTVMAVGRSSPSQDSLDAFKMMQEKYGTRVRFVQADVGQPKGIQILEDVLDKSDPIAGIVNSAVVLDDRFFTDVDRDNYRKVMGPKVVGKSQICKEFFGKGLVMTLMIVSDFMASLHL